MVVRACRAAYLAVRHACAHSSDMLRGSRLCKAGRDRSPDPSRPCPACLATDGKVFSLNQPPAMLHVCCQRTIVPVPADPYDCVTANLQTGSEWFTCQDDQTKRRIFGPQPGSMPVRMARCHSTTSSGFTRVRTGGVDLSAVRPALQRREEMRIWGSCHLGSAVVADRVSRARSVATTPARCVA